MTHLIKTVYMSHVTMVLIATPIPKQRERKPASTQYKEIGIRAPMSEKDATQALGCPYARKVMP
jgi:hypothetical protein